MEKSALVQVVVKIKSMQSLETIIKGTEEGDDTSSRIADDDNKRLVEYLVLQRIMIDGEEQPWMVWGTTQETSVDQALSQDSVAEVPRST